MANLYWASDFVGGAAGCLDAISVTDAGGNLSMVPLQVGDAALVVSQTSGAEFYILQNSAGAVENGRTVIIPDDNTGNLWWKQVQLGVPKDICVPYLGNTIPSGWTKFDGTTANFVPGDIIRKS